MFVTSGRRIEATFTPPPVQLDEMNLESGSMGVGAPDHGDFSVSVKRSFLSRGEHYEAELETTAAINKEPLLQFPTPRQAPLELAALNAASSGAATGLTACVTLGPFCLLAALGDG